MGRMDIAPIKEYEAGTYVAEVPVMPITHKSLYVLKGWAVQYIIFFLAIFLMLLTIWTDKNSKILKSIISENE